jgi:CBS domain containing-hemolysin-like protein
MSGSAWQTMLRSTSLSRKAALLCAALAAFAAGPASASFLSGEALDTAADVIAIVVLIVVPVVVIVVFWMVHVLPERFAEKRHHPQTAAIQTLCLLSLVFGGLLWPIAWLWAFTKPVAYRVAYGTDKAEEWHEEMGEKARAGELLEGELEHLRHELDAMAARGALPAKLKQLRADLAQIQSATPVPPAEGGKA